ncbi:MAG: C-GCAxxG-C-C family protein [Chloroflexi bacterium]|nr:C-GCAxxG-C-C family protein [Chloroflexota bacterium]
MNPGPALGLGGGIGHRQDACGAVTGGSIAIGMLLTERIEDHKEAKAAAQQVVGDYYHRFAEKFGTAGCMELIQVPILTQEEIDHFRASGLREERCEKYITFAVEDLIKLRDYAPKAL